MMLKFVALWNIREGVSETEFERWYRDVHMPDAKRIPGLRRYTVNRVTDAARGESRYYRMAELSFDSHDAMQEALRTPQWQHAFNDAQRYITDHLRLKLDSEDVPLD